MKLLIIFAALFTAGVAQAKMEVKQINLTNESVAVSNARGVGVGDVLLYTHQGQQCDLPVVAKKGTYAIASLSGCRFKQNIRSGQTVEKSLLTGNISSRTPTSAGSLSSSAPFGSINPELRESLQGLSLFGYRSMASDATSTGEDEQGETSNSELPGDHAFGFGAEYGFSDLPTPGFSTIFGASYELEREYDKIRRDGNTQTIANGGIRLSTWVIHANLGLNLNSRVRGLAGVNFSIPLESGPSEFEGQLGYQVGGSYAFTDHFAVDGLYRFLNYQDDDDFDISLDGLLVRGRLVF